MKKLKSIKSSFLVIFAIGLSLSLGTNIGGTLFSMYAALYFNASNSTIGLLAAVGTLVSLLITLPSGVLSDKFGRKPMIIIGLIAGLIGFAILFVASSIGMLFVAQIVMGFSWPIFGPSIQALVADLASPDKSGKAVGLYLLGPSIGMFLGPLIASLLLRFISIRDSYLYSLIVILVSFILALLIKPVKSTLDKPVRIPMGNFGKTMRNKIVLISSIVSASFFFLNSSIMTFYPIYALQEYRADPAMISAVFSIRNLALMLVRILAVTRLASKIGERKLIVTALMTSISVAIMPLTKSYGQSAILITLTGVGHGIIFPMGAMIIAESTSPQERGTANSIYLLFNNINSTLSPVLMGFAAEVWGTALLFPMVTIASVIGLIISKHML